MKIGFIGLGNVGGKLAGNLLNNGADLTVHDLDAAALAPLQARGAAVADSPAGLTKAVDVVITCLPSPEACAAVMQGADGILSALTPDKIWAEMSTTDASEMTRLAALVEQTGAAAIECPVSGGCHRAATGNISIFAGCDRATFDRMLPVLTILGRRVLHTGAIGSASKLKVMTNYLATTHLVAVAEALTTMQAAGLDAATTYEAIRISSGNSFVHETESQVILNGSRDINFTMDLVLKDIGLFQSIAEDHDVPLSLSPLLVQLFEEANASFGPREHSPNIIRRYEEPLGLKVHAPGFPAEMVDDEPPAQGAEVVPRRG